MVAGIGMEIELHHDPLTSLVKELPTAAIPVSSLSSLALLSDRRSRLIVFSEVKSKGTMHKYILSPTGTIL
jgi:hypothetical protein